MRQVVSKLALAAILSAGLAAPALADVNVTATIRKTKDITVTETLTVTKQIFFTLAIHRNLNTAAEAMALVNHTIRNNLVDRNVTNNSGLDFDLGATQNGPISRFSLLGGSPGPDDSVSGNFGVTGLNQDVGNMTNQGNAWSVGASQASRVDPTLFVDAQAEVDQVVSFNAVVLVGPYTFPDGTGGQVPVPGFGPNGGQVFFTANIENAINNNSGLTAVNQNVGNMNNQSNSVAVAAGLFDPAGTGPDFGGVAVALAEAALGQENTNNRVVEGPNGPEGGPGPGVDKLVTMVSSVRGNTGVTQVNQSGANMGNQGNVVAVGAAVVPNL